MTGGEGVKSLHSQMSRVCVQHSINMTGRDDQHQEGVGLCKQLKTEARLSQFLHEAHQA